MTGTANMADQPLFLGLDHWEYGALLTYAVPPFRLYEAPEPPDYRVYTYRVSQGTDSFSTAPHIPGEVDIYSLTDTKTQVSVDFDLGVLSIGRESFSWGPSPFCNLALSSYAKPYDYVALTVPLGQGGTFSWVTGLLEDFSGLPEGTEGRKIINAHRVELQFFPWFLFAIYESIIYSYRFELNYLNPLSLYYASEVRLGDYDNKLGGIDLVFRIPHVKLYVSLFADDWDRGHPFEFNYYHNEWAGLFGVELYELIPRVSVFAEYARLSHWMYTHRSGFSDARHDHNNYVHYDTHLGHFLNPNSHMLYLELGYNLEDRLTIESSFRFTQDGRGDIDTPPDWAAEGALPSWPYNVFLDGVVETNYDWTSSVVLRLPQEGSMVKVSYSLAYTHNVGKIEGISRWDHILGIEVGWMTMSLR